MAPRAVAGARRRRTELSTAKKRIDCWGAMRRVEALARQLGPHDCAGVNLEERSRAGHVGRAAKTAPFERARKQVKPCENATERA